MIKRKILKLIIIPILAVLIIGFKITNLNNLSGNATSSIICSTDNCTGIFENGKCNSCNHQFAASIGNVGYDDFSTALLNAVSGDMIYCYTSYENDFTIPQGVTLDGGTNEFSGYVINNGTINNGKFTKESSGATEEEESFPGFDELLNGPNSNAFGVVNNGIINNGVFLSRLENNAVINNGIFNNDITINKDAVIYDGLLYGTITNYGNFFSGKTINELDNYGVINGGDFASIDNMEEGIINGGVFSNQIINNGVINNLNEGDIILKGWFKIINNGEINCNVHIRTNDSNEYVCDCRICKKVKHKVVIDKYVEPTCTDTGLTEGFHCSECEEVFCEQDEIEALGHSHSNIMSYSENEHWNSCHCGDVINKNLHIDLNKDRICDDCGYKFKLPKVAVVGIVCGAVVLVSISGFLVYRFVIKKKNKK